MLNSLNNLKEFRAEQKLQVAALSFMVNQLTSTEDIADLKATFRKLDVNRDGVLS